MGQGLGIEEILGPHRQEVLRLGHRYGAEGFRVFGSVRRQAADDASDVDLLVRWNHRTTLQQIARFHQEVERLLGRRVDLVEEGQLPWAMAPQIEAEALPL